MSLLRFVRLAAHIQLMPVLESGEETLIGGQAVMEGVMMRSPHSFCIAVRRPDGEIVTQEQPLARLSERHKLFKLPLIRGVGTLGSAMALGMRALQFSANAALQDGEKKEETLGTGAMALQLLTSLAFFLFLYKWVPLKLADLLARVYPALHGHFANALVDGVIRMILFLGFLFALSRFKDIRRVFQYHGAEHKVVFNYESGEAVTVTKAQSFVTYHPRCGTSFLLVVMVLSMIVYMFIPFDGFWAKFASRIVLLPVILGLSYELIRFAARRPGSLLSLLTTPGLWLQKITTQEPDNQQVEVSITALQGAMALEAKQGGELVVA